MKRCPRCGKTYNEPLNFCLDDGELLLDEGPQRPLDDAPPTVMMSDARTTNPTNWSAPPVQYQAPQMWQQPMYGASPNQTLAVVSMCLGIGSLTIGWCCYLGLLLGPAALITGGIGLSQASKDSERYGGRGMAIAGIITGAVAIVGYIIFFIVIAAMSSLGN
ncbi:MAG: DUF4190 domain-containing protein [Pyrinomonadaceae bacterium]|nr:DUF4190 domain-containing protein [Pyrinomonadaceae bacterium]